MLRSAGLYLKEKYLFLIGILLSLILLWPLFKAPYFTHHDDVQVIRLHQMNECIQDLQIPCRWVPDLGGLYGYPLFNYYGPLPYYFGEIVYLFSNSFIFSAKVMFAASFIGSFLFMYLFVKKLWGELGGILAGLFYSYAPYHAVDFYVRGAMGEMWALMFFPAIFWAILRLWKDTNWKNSVVISILTAMLITSHNLSTLVFAPFILLFILVLYIYKNDVKFVTLSVFGLILALFVSAFYWAPALLEKGLVHVETTISGYFSYTEHFKGLRKLFFERTWGWGASIREIPGGERDGMSFQIGIVHTLTWLAVLVLTFINRKKEKFAFLLVLFFSLSALFSIFMIHPRSVFVWNLIEPISFLQFPWRLLMLVIFFVSIVAGSLAKFIPNKVLTFVTSFLVFVVVVLNFSYFRPQKFVNLGDQEYLSGLNWDKQIKRSIFDYLPKSAKFPPAELATADYEILEGKATVVNFQEGSDWIKFDIIADENSLVQVSSYYFPTWKLFINGYETEFSLNSDLGLVTFPVEHGSYSVELRLYNTPVRSLSNLSSLLGILVAVAILKKRD